MFTLEMRTTNDEFGQDGVNAAVARALREIANKVAAGSEVGVVFDLNGNGIGKFEIDERAEDRQIEHDETYDQLISSWDDLKAQAEAMYDAQGDLIDDDAEQRRDLFVSDDVLSIDPHHTVDVLLGFQNPTEWVTISLTDDGREAVSMLWTKSSGDVEATRRVTNKSALWFLMADVAGVEA